MTEIYIIVLYGVKQFMDKNKFKIILIIFILFCICFFIACMVYVKFNKKKKVPINQEIIYTDTNTTIRVIDTFNKSMFQNKDTALIMWATWCKNCEEELEDLKNILNYYKNLDLQVILVAHEFEKQELIDFIQQKMDFGCEVYLDLNRTIRHNIDEEEDSVPVTYFLDEKCNVINKHRGPISFEKFKELAELSYAS